jgi:uncharacterized protein (TIGR02453 family)
MQKESILAEIGDFTGFSPTVLDFYRDLSRNNDREWFEAHKHIYKDEVIPQAQRFVVAMGDRLRQISPTLVYDTRTNGAGSIFRIYRDVRFSKDKTPYKTQLGIYFWEGAWRKMEAPGFYFQLEPEHLGLYAGIYEFSRPVLERYRQQVIDPHRGQALVDAVSMVTGAGPYRIGGQHFKRTPRGFDPEHPNASWLLHNGLHAHLPLEIPDTLGTPAFIDTCFQAFRDMAPLHHWLTEMLAS